MPLPNGPGWSYTYSNDDGTCTSIKDEHGNNVPLSFLKPWPPPLKAESKYNPSGPPTSFSGDPPQAIQWRKADLTIVFICTDVAHAVSFQPGYVIPPTLQCRPISGQQWSTIPTIALAYDPPNFGSRYGYQDDIAHPSQPPGSFTVSDVQHMLLGMDSLIVVGCPMFGVIPPPGPVAAQSAGGGPDRWLQAVSALSGAGIEIGNTYQGHVVPVTTGNATLVGDNMFAAADAYARHRGLTKVDFAFICDNTGSMGSQQAYFQQCTLACVRKLVDAGYDSYFAYATFADFPYTDWPGWIVTGSGQSGDTSFQVRFPFSPLNDITAAQFGQLYIPGQGGSDSPEDALEALGRVLLGKARALGPLAFGGLDKMGMRFDPANDPVIRGHSRQS